MSKPLAILCTLIIVISVRESAVIICEQLGFASAANIVGMVVLFVLLILWRSAKGLPEWLISASSTLLIDSGFAFLPVSAGAGILLFALGDAFWGFMVTVIVSTLLPLWALAYLTQYWLQDHRHNSSDSSSQTSK